MPAINLTNDELATVTAAIRRTIEDDRFPHAPRLDPLCAALGKLEAALEPVPPPKAPTVTVGKRARRTASFVGPKPDAKVVPIKIRATTRATT